MNLKNIGDIVESALDLRNPEPFTEDELRQLDSLGRIEDSQIDYTDASPTPVGTEWTRPGSRGGPVGNLRRSDQDVAAPKG